MVTKSSSISNRSLSSCDTYLSSYKLIIFIIRYPLFTHDFAIFSMHRLRTTARSSKLAAFKCFNEFILIDCQPVFDFLGCKTPDSWLETACKNIPILLINHCYLEQCAARNAVIMMNRYPSKTDLLLSMSKLAREELIHFERVLKILNKREIAYKALKPSRYAGLLQAEVRKQEPDKFVDSMIVGAFIEARSCERFYHLAPLLDAELTKFYTSLLQSEARHFEDYLDLAKKYTQSDISDRIDFFREIERNAILSPDPQFRFHSGMPMSHQSAA